MVVARKAPSAPAPSGSRSTSSQVLQKTKTQQSLATKPAPPSASDAAKAKQEKEKKNQKQPLKRSKPWSARLFLLLLSLFSVYAFSICPNDHPRTSSVCHSLDLYKTYVLDPYLVPPIRSLLHHADPHLDPLKPYVVPAITYTRTHIAPRITALASFTTNQFHNRVVPAYDHYICHHLWSAHIKPYYYTTLHPRVYPYTRPYILYYRYRLRPALRAYSARVSATYALAKPHALRAAAHTRLFYATARDHACAAYSTAMPHVQVAYVRVKPHAVALGESARVHALRLMRDAAAARRVYVDPHVRRIWETVSEKPVMREGRTSTPDESPADVVDEPSSVVSVTKEFLAPTPTTTIGAVSEAAPLVPVEETETEAMTVTEREPTIAPSFVPPSISIPESEASPVPTTEPESESAASVVAQSLHPGSVGVVASEAGAAGEDVVDEFLRDIGIASEEGAGESQAEEEDAEEQQEQEAEKQGSTPESKPRAGIVARHGKWERELQDLVRSAEGQVRAVLGEVRAAAVKELAEYGSEKHERRGVVGVVEEEAGRFVKGLEGYLRGAEGRVTKFTKAEEVRMEEKTWYRVLEKTEEKFSEKVGEVQVDVHGWYLKVKEQEGGEVGKTIEKVRTFAQNAQGDLALDYAWLEDVTYLDWQRYHDLIRVSENFTTVARALQSGNYSAPAAARTVPVEDTLLEALGRVESEVGEVVEGFQAAVAEVGRRAGRMFADAKEVGDAMEGEGKEIKGKKTNEEGKASILPVEPIGTAVPAPGLEEGVERIFLGRSKEEVEEKLRAAAVGAGAGVEQTGRDEL